MKRNITKQNETIRVLYKFRRVNLIIARASAAAAAAAVPYSSHMEPGDIIIDGGNEWYENTERRQKALNEKGLLYLGMGVSGGEEGARNGPAMMPGGDKAAFDTIEEVVKKVCAQTDTGPCVTYVGPGGAGNFVKMVHNGIEYGDMQLISEAYDVLKTVGGLTNSELADAFNEWNAAELDSFLIEISALILAKEDDQKAGEGFLVDKILDKTGMKGTGKWTVQQAAELSVAIPTVASSLDARFLSGVKVGGRFMWSFIQTQTTNEPNESGQLFGNEMMMMDGFVVFHEVFHFAFFLFFFFSLCQERNGTRSASKLCSNAWMGGRLVVKLVVNRTRRRSALRRRLCTPPPVCPRRTPRLCRCPPRRRSSWWTTCARRCTPPRFARTRRA